MNRRKLNPGRQTPSCIICVLVTLFWCGCGGSERESADSPEDLPVASEPNSTDDELQGTSAPQLGSTKEASQTEASPVSPSSDRETIVMESQRYFEDGDYDAASKALRTLILQDPGDADALFRLANVVAASGDLGEAVEILDEIPSDHPQAGIASLGQSADWCMKLGRFDDAEGRYRQILQSIPNAAPALRQLARIFNRQGRRHEAATVIRQLCKIGDVRQDELHALISLSDAMYDEPPSPNVNAGETSGYWPIGPSGMARKFFQDEEYVKAVEELQSSVADGTATPAINALYGRAVAEAQDGERFRWWLSKVDQKTREFSEYWAGLGTYLLGEARFDEAARALAEAVDRDPTDLRSLSRLRQVFLVKKDDALADRLEKQWTRIRETIRANNEVAAASPPNVESIEELAGRLEKLDRTLEAVMWRALAQYYRQASDSEKNALNQRRQQILADDRLFPGPAERLCGIRLSDYPLPELDSSTITSSPVRRSENNKSATPATFENIAPVIDLDHTYFVASRPTPFGFAIHQMLGGGIAVFDYDADGRTDLYLAQGHSDSPDFVGSSSNQLLRQVDGRVIDVSQLAGASDLAYTTAVTAGDWNQDGFPDLVLRNMLQDVLLINQGDGSFARVVLADRSTSHRVPASTAIADLTGDGIPDIFHANYVDDPRRFMKPPVGESGRPTEPILPSKFQAGKNELVENDGTGQIKEIRGLSSEPGSDATSLGIVITDFDHVPGNEIFVANDLKPNRLWWLDSDQSWSDLAAIRGCAFSSTGASTASMGVAAADFQNNGTLDLHITNYQNESASLYLGEAGLYQDKNLKFRIAKDSFSVLGFGTQSIDYDNDGHRDLVVTNGHIDDAISNTGPFHQPAQLFANLQDRFEMIDVRDPSGYWQTDHLGRTMASLDFNADGKLDLVISHIDEPTALLLNQTETTNHWVQLQLVGTKSERDSIGARVSVTIGDETQTAWVMAGDGYLCSNESLICFGIGAAESVNSLEVYWPTGETQEFRNVPIDQRILLVEDQKELFVFEP